MKKKILMLCMGCFLASLTAKAQWVVSDPGNLAQGIINAAKNIVHTSSTATNMANNFQETVKIYKQGKEYYDGLRKVKNLVRDARKVQQTVLMVGDITDIYVTNFERMLSDPYLTPEELSVYRRGRNAHSPTMAKHATMADYRRATGFEALMGYLYLKEDYTRMLTLIRMGIGEDIL